MFSCPDLVQICSSVWLVKNTFFKAEFNYFTVWEYLSKMSFKQNTQTPEHFYPSFFDEDTGIGYD